MNHNFLIRNDVVGEVRVEGGADLSSTTFDHGDKAKKSSSVVRFRKTFTIHDSAACEFGIGKQKAVRCHQLDSWCVAPAAEEFVKNASRC